MDNTSSLYNKYHYPFHSKYIKRNVEIHGTPGANEGDHVVFDIKFNNETNGEKIFANVDEFKGFLSKYYEFEKVEGWEDDGGHFVVYKITKDLLK